MRLLTKEQFHKEPYGTVYCLFEPMMFTSDIYIKHAIRGTKFGASWWALDIVPSPIAKSSCESIDGFTQAYDSPNTHIDTEYFCTDDATYNHNDKTMFAVFDIGEVEDMIGRLQKSIDMLNGKVVVE